MGRGRTREEKLSQILTTVKHTPLPSHKIKIHCGLQAREYKRILRELVEQGLLEVREDKTYGLTGKGGRHLRDNPAS